jgi:transaldolase
MGALPGFRIAVFSDGADVQQMIAAHKERLVDGFTTNPTLMRKAGVREYRAFAGEVLKRIQDMPVCFEVLADDVDTMETQAREIADWGRNVFVKVPVCTTSGESTVPLVGRLVRDGLRINVTAIAAPEQVRAVSKVVTDEVPTIVSIFAGRIADTGRDPVPFMRAAVEQMQDRPNVQILWASPREVLNVYQAEDCGCHIIAITPELRAKLSLKDKDLLQFSRETVQMFFDDARQAGFEL